MLKGDFIAIMSATNKTTSLALSLDIGDKF
jgi:hypothetical protein